MIVSSVALVLLAGCSSGDSSAKKDVDTGQAQKSAVPLTSSDAPVPSPVIAEETTQASTLTVKQKLEDFDYMCRILMDNYPFFEVNRRLYGDNWAANIEQFRNIITDAKTDAEFYKSMNFVVNRLNNGHTSILTEGLYTQLLQLYSDDDPTLKVWNAPWLNVLRQPNVLARYNQEVQHQVVEEGDSSSTSEEANTTQKSSGNVQKIIITPNQTAYLGLKSFDNKFMEMDSTEISTFFKGIKDYKTLIIDIRGNEGGNNLYWKHHIVPLLINNPISYDLYLLYRGGDYADDFLKARNLTEGLKPISEIKKEQLPYLPSEATTLFKFYSKITENIEPDHSVGFKGKIYLLVDGAVFSASDGFASFAQNSDFATVVGERTAGDGININPILAALPNSGYVFRFSTAMGLTSDGSCNEEVKTIPDVVVDPDTSGPLLEQPAIQKVLELTSSH